MRVLLHRSSSSKSELLWSKNVCTTRCQLFGAYVPLWHLPACCVWLLASSWHCVHVEESCQWIQAQFRALSRTTCCDHGCVNNQVCSMTSAATYVCLVDTLAILNEHVAGSVIVTAHNWKSVCPFSGLCRGQPCPHTMFPMEPLLSVVGVHVFLCLLTCTAHWICLMHCLPRPSPREMLVDCQFSASLA